MDAGAARSPSSKRVCEYTIEAWGDFFRSWQHEFAAKFAAQQPDLTSETLEGAQFVEHGAALAEAAGNARDAKRLRALAQEIRAALPAAVNEMLHWQELEGLMTAWADRREACEFLINPPPPAQLVESSGAAVAAVSDAGPPKKTKGRAKKGEASAAKRTAPAGLMDPGYSGGSARYPQIFVDRPRAGFAAWYEFFPRSAEGLPDLGSKFRDCVPRVEDAKAMGFDVIYFPPIHPVGVTARKGRNTRRASRAAIPSAAIMIAKTGVQLPVCERKRSHRATTSDAAPLAV